MGDFVSDDGKVCIVITGFNSIRLLSNRIDRLSVQHRKKFDITDFRRGGVGRKSRYEMCGTREDLEKLVSIIDSDAMEDLRISRTIMRKING